MVLAPQMDAQISGASATDALLMAGPARWEQLLQQALSVYAYRDRPLADLSRLVLLS